MKKVLMAFLLIIVLLVVISVGAMYLGYTITNGTTNLNNISVDGINVEKLADMVKTQAENTQFVVVSHRKPMIESANRTIGVTQKEHGKTRVTGVKFRD